MLLIPTVANSMYLFCFSDVLPLSVVELIGDALPGSLFTPHLPPRLCEKNRIKQINAKHGKIMRKNNNFNSKIIK